MTNKTVYPEWVQNYRTRGTTVKKIRNTYYLYKRTSKRVPRKKYPQPVDTYIGIITPETYLSKERKIRSEDDFHYQFAAQMSSLSRNIYKEHGIEISELQKLKTIYLVYLEGETIVAQISAEQKQLLERLEVNIEMC